MESSQESSKENAFAKLDQDAYDYFLEAGSFAGVIKQAGLPEQLPTWEAFLAHPTYDAYSRSRAVEPHETRVEVPTLEVGGWWDQEDMWGPQAEYAALKPHDTRHKVSSCSALGTMESGAGRRAPWGRWTLANCSKRPATTTGLRSKSLF